MEREHTKEELDLICKNFEDNPNINPETGARLVFGKSPYLYYADLCERHNKAKIPQDDVIIYNIILNTPVLDLLALYSTDSNFRRILTNSHTIDELYNKYIAKNYMIRAKEDFEIRKQYLLDTQNNQILKRESNKLIDNLNLYNFLIRNKSFDNFIEAYNLLLSHNINIHTNLVDFHYAIESYDFIFTLSVAILIEYFIDLLLKFIGKNSHKIEGIALKLINEETRESIKNMTVLKENYNIFSFAQTIKQLDKTSKTIPDIIKEIDKIANKILKEILDLYSYGYEITSIIHLIFKGKEDIKYGVDRVKRALDKYAQNPFIY